MMNKYQIEKKASAQVEQERFDRIEKDEFGIDRRISKDGRTMVSYGYEVINPEPGRGRTQDALRRQRDRIVHLPLIAEDSNTTGDKYTRCTWGMCDESKDLWPDPDDHIWPDMFINNGRIAPRDYGLCPMDTRQPVGTNEILGNSMGCFYACRIFQRSHKTPDREEAIKLYDDMIAHRERTEGKLTVSDDNGEENWNKDYEIFRRKVQDIKKIQ